MKKRPFVRGKKGWPESKPDPPAEPKGPKPTILRKHQTALPIDAKVARIQPGRVLLIPTKRDVERDALAEVWKAAGGEVRRLGRFWEPPPDLKERNVCVYGNDIFCQVLAQLLELNLVSPPEDILARLPLRMSARGVSVSSLSLARDLEYPAFIKSLQPKLFAAAVFGSPQELRSKTRGLEADTGLLVSEPVEFEAEVRVFVYDRKVLDCSAYQGEADLEAAAAFASEVVKTEGLPFGYVVDLGKLSQGWAVVEFNPAWASGLNGCDADKVLPAIAAATRAR